MIDEGYIKFTSRWQQSDAVENPAIAELIEWRKPLYAAGLIGHYEDIGIGYGNMSARTDAQGRFIISGTQTGHISELKNEHFALVTAFDVDANTVNSEGATEASSESMTHATLYQLNADIRAVVHIHSDDLWARLKGLVPTTDEGVAYGTPAMAIEFDRLLKHSDFGNTGIAVMAGHAGGLISTGNSVQEAAEKLLTLQGRH
jgi:L-ribulose-5-phosphate 4-epimerase